MVIEVDGEVHKLNGSAEAQYTQWRDLMKKIYASETGLEPETPAESKPEENSLPAPQILEQPETQL